MLLALIPSLFGHVTEGGYEDQCSGTPTGGPAGYRRALWTNAGEFRPLADGAIVTYLTFEAGYIIAAMPQRVIEFLRGISLFG